LVTIENHEKYIALLDILGKECDSVCLVDPLNLGYDPDHIPISVISLKPYLIDTERVYMWPGTEMEYEREEDKAIMYRYRCCEESMGILKKYDSFYDIEADIDVSFFVQDRCIFYTISHETMLFADEDFVKDTFKDCMAPYIPNAFDRIIYCESGFMSMIKMQLVTIENHEKYIALLDILGKECDSVCLVDPLNSGYDPDRIPISVISLNPYLIDTERVYMWPGTEMGYEREEDKAIMYRYRCCEESMDVLKKYDSFYDIEADIDISFFVQDRCVFHTITDETMLFADEDFIAKNRDKNVITIFNEGT
jgi:hypothetical protein